ncbi:MAG: putative toxin-antitoxin system toxin component, PIN family [Actinomycetaceae bacterium]|nr:putative toxin-antitoxin system toxin component, PIN family [Actinomycetaceae bacterium]
MRVLIDTNVLISAAINPVGTPYRAYTQAVSFPNQGIICDQNIIELKDVFARKFPTKLEALERFLSVALLVLELVEVLSRELGDEKQIRDLDDRPILRAAIAAKADVLITGDKDFLESGLKKPMIMTPAQFLAEGGKELSIPRLRR